MRSRTTRAILVLAMLPLLAGCIPLPRGDSSVSLDVLNRNSDQYVVGVGLEQAGICLAIEPESFGGVYSETGTLDDAPEVRLFSADGTFIRTLDPESSHALFVFDAGGVERQYELKYKQGPPDVGLVYDLPEVPELDGRPTPELFPRTSEVCGA